MVYDVSRSRVCSFSLWLVSGATFAPGEFAAPSAFLRSGPDSTLFLSAWQKTVYRRL